MVPNKKAANMIAKFPIVMHVKYIILLQLEKNRKQQKPHNVLKHQGLSRGRHQHGAHLS
jgi:hypothetical protein